MDGHPDRELDPELDNLSSKGLLHFLPDRVFVWNSTQRDELAPLSPDSGAQLFRVTGAQTFDHWFMDEPLSEREDFCARNGLDPGRPIVLYLASSRQLESAAAGFLRTLARRGQVERRAPARCCVDRAFTPSVPTSTPGSSLALDDPGLAISPSTADAAIHSPEFRRRYRDEAPPRLDRCCAQYERDDRRSDPRQACLHHRAAGARVRPARDDPLRVSLHRRRWDSCARRRPFAQHVAELEGLIDRDPYERDRRKATRPVRRLRLALAASTSVRPRSSRPRCSASSMSRQRWRFRARPLVASPESSTAPHRFSERHSVGAGARLWCARTGAGGS